MDRENVIKGLNDIGAYIAGRIGFEQSKNFLKFLDETIALLKEQDAVVHCGDCENFCFDNISPNAGRCMLTNISHSKTWFCANGKREESR